MSKSHPRPTSAPNDFIRCPESWTGNQARFICIILYVPRPCHIDHQGLLSFALPVSGRLSSCGERWSTPVARSRTGRRGMSVESVTEARCVVHSPPLDCWHEYEWVEDLSSDLDRPLPQSAEDLVALLHAAIEFKKITPIPLRRSPRLHSDLDKLLAQSSLQPNLCCGNGAPVSGDGASCMQ